ncbi:L,D-transpeptidase family protein [Aridibaculum aurantiacum]|uniref:L,D-transpeptidase family protein n=1 Tax=Aridibaculum aurantiacum TaxID=2810307 RepID=UPI001A964AFA|nr:L,D-transpeptidase family protein [Aridibaculum aurantiacum]
MKNTLFALACTLLFIACNSSGDQQSEKKTEKEKKISSRDYSITQANAYNDIFIDSLTVATYIDSINTSDKVKRRITSFYNARNYQFAWFSSEGLTEQAKGFWNLFHYDAEYRSDSLQRDEKLKRKMDDLFTASNVSISATDRSTIQTELILTRLFIEHGLELYEEGYVKRKEMERFIPLKKTDPLKLADSLLTKKHKDDKYYEDINESYRKLKEYLGRYMEVAKKGGWPIIESKEKSLKPGASSPTILAIKKRLQLSGEYNGQDTTMVYDPSLEPVIKNFQERHGYTPDGVIAASTIKELNMPVEQAIQKLLINLDRMRWLPSKPEGNLILVNIPEFVMHVMEGEKKVFDMNVVVGKEGNNTVIFTDDLDQVVFSPYWNVPPSIVREEILPAMSRNPNYLAGQNMEIVKDGGDLPVVRQLPGAGNALGKVKFLFPNSFNIYFHDTPSKSLFSRDKRAFSHGCIRLQEPEKMANYLLRNDPEWTPEKINAAMNSGTEKYVKLKQPVPVFITYYTAWVDEQGRLNFRDDIYGHDEKLAKKMFGVPAQPAMATK